MTQSNPNNPIHIESVPLSTNHPLHPNEKPQPMDQDEGNNEGNLLNPNTRSYEAESYEEDLENSADPQGESLAEQDLTLRLSQSLASKLNLTARDEGITVEELAAELIAEGVVLRAWEIVERKHTMRGGSPGNTNSGFRPHQSNGNSQVRNPQNQRNFNQGNHSPGHHHPKGNNRRPTGQGNFNKRQQSHSNNLNLMEDKAAFLEYVRNQEKKRR